MPDLPPLAVDVWGIFLQLRRRGGSTGFGPAPLDDRGLLDWQALHGQTLTAWEIEAIFALDELWMKAQAEARAQAD